MLVDTFLEGYESRFLWIVSYSTFWLFVTSEAILDDLTVVCLLITIYPVYWIFYGTYKTSWDEFFFEVFDSSFDLTDNAELFYWT